MLVEGVTKLKNIPIFNKEQQQAENVRKMMLAMSKDIRVIIIKLCDRLHNMHTLGFRPPDKQRNTASETMHIYVPLANRLGIRAVKDELEDLAFRYAKEMPGVDPLNLVIKYIRTGVDRYNSGSWGIMAGYEDKGFADFVSKYEDDYNANLTEESALLTVSWLKKLGNIHLS